MKYICFDLDGTLIPEEFDGVLWNEEIPKEYAKEHNVTLKRAKEKVYSAYYAALMIETVDDWTDIDMWFDRLKLKDWKGFLELMKRDLCLHPGVIEILKRLSKTYKLVLFTNSNHHFLQMKLQATQIESYFTHIISSTSDFGMDKKNHKAYEKLLHTIGCTANEIIHIGNSLTTDIVPAQTVGIKTYFIHNNFPFSNYSNS